VIDISLCAAKNLRILGLASRNLLTPASVSKGQLLTSIEWSLKIKILFFYNKNLFFPQKIFQKNVTLSRRQQALRIHHQEVAFQRDKVLEYLVQNTQSY